jgi:hypothetical protein
MCAVEGGGGGGAGEQGMVGLPLWTRVFEVDSWQLATGWAALEGISLASCAAKPSESIHARTASLCTHAGYLDTLISSVSHVLPWKSMVRAAVPAALQCR